MSNALAGGVPQGHGRELTLAAQHELAVQQQQRLSEISANARTQAKAPQAGIIDLRDYWRILMRHKRTILSVLGIAVLVGLLFTFLSTPIYRATLLLQIEREESKVLDFQSLTPQEASTSKDFYQTQYSLLRSRSLARRVIDQLGLRASGALGARQDPSSLKTAISDLVAWVQGRRPDEEPAKVDLEKLFLKNLTVAPEKNSRLVQIHYDSSIPEEAAAVANAIAENFINTSLERRYDASAYAKTFLEERIEQVRASLEDSEQRLVDYARNLEIVNLEDRFDIIMESLRQMSAQLGEAEAERIAAEARYEEMLNLNGGANVSLLESAVIQTLKERKAALEAEYQEKSAVFKPGYPKMQELRRQIAELNHEIARESTAITSAVKTTFQAAARREAMLRGRVREIKDDVLTLQNRSTGYQTLKRDVETNRELYDGLLQRMKEIGVTAGIGTNNISVVDAAEVPFERFKPNVKKNLALAIAVGLFGGILLAFVLEAADDTLKTREDVEEHIGAPVLGIIPFANEESTTLTDSAVSLISHHAPTSTLAEAYRSLRTALLFSSPQGAPRVLHFTSALPQEGKTTSAINAAIAFAQTGAKVLLIDADLRNPSVHKDFNLANTVGLSNYLTSDLAPDEVAQPTQVTRLFAITSGVSAPHPVELLSSARMLDLISNAAKKFDYVIIDGPPVIGLADALVLANLANATVFVVAAGSSTAASVDNAIRRLADAGATLLGATLTKCTQATSGYGYDYHYSYGGHDARQQPSLPGRANS